MSYQVGIIETASTTTFFTSSPRPVIRTDYHSYLLFCTPKIPGFDVLQIFQVIHGGGPCTMTSQQRGLPRGLIAQPAKVVAGASWLYPFKV